MSRPTERAEQLRRSVAVGRLDLDAALTTLSIVSTEKLSLGHHMAKRPWHWLAGACAAGLVLAMLTSDDRSSRP